MRTGRLEELLLYHPQLQHLRLGQHDAEPSEGMVDVRELSDQVEKAYATIAHLKDDKREFGRNAHQHWFCATLIDIRNRQLSDEARQREKGREEETHAVYVSAREYYALMPAFLYDKFVRSRARRLESLRKQQDPANTRCDRTKAN